MAKDVTTDQSVISAADSESTVTFLGWVAESYDTHAKTAAEHPEEADAYQGSAQMARDHAVRLEATFKSQTDEIDRLRWERDAFKGLLDDCVRVGKRERDEQTARAEVAEAELEQAKQDRNQSGLVWRDSFDKMHARAMRAEASNKKLQAFVGLCRDGFFTNDDDELKQAATLAMQEVQQ